MMLAVSVAAMVGLGVAAGTVSAQEDGGSEPCDGPQNVRVTATAAGNLVEWDAWPFARAYEVWRAVPGGEFEQIGVTSGANPDNPNSTGTHDTDLLDEKVVPGQTYQYKVRALAPPPHVSAFCGTITVTAIPVFPTLIAGAVSVIGGLGVSVWARRRA